MFGIFEAIIKTAAVVVDLPVAVVADVVTLGGINTNKNTTYSEDALGRFVKNVSDITK